MNNFRINHVCRKHPTGAFMMVELLVVIAIIAVLAALLLPVLWQAKATALRIKCVSNLRQVGVAIQKYDNDHEDKLPGPVWMGQPFEYDRTTTNNLPCILADYLGTPAPSVRLVKSEVFMCPAYARFAPEAALGAERISLVVNQDIDPGPLKVRPFGYPARNGFPTSYPVKLPDLNQYGNRADIFALTDADKNNSPEADNPWFNQLPAKPVHGHSRNHLFFDGHVASRRAP